MTAPLRRELPEETHALIYELIMSARVYGRLDTHAALAKMEKAKEALCEHIARARAEEREEAAKVAQRYSLDEYAARIAAAIRARQN